MRPGSGRDAMRRYFPDAGSKVAPSLRAWYWSITNPPTTSISLPVQTAVGSPRVASGPGSKLRHVPTPAVGPVVDVVGTGARPISGRIAPMPVVVEVVVSFG